jgi:hypothetical protein
LAFIRQPFDKQPGLKSSQHRHHDAVPTSAEIYRGRENGSLMAAKNALCPRELNVWITTVDCGFAAMQWLMRAPMIVVNTRAGAA